MSPATPSCDRLFRSLEDCRRKHPRQLDVCERLNAAAGWCAIRTICPDEGGSLGVLREA